VTVKHVIVNSSDLGSDWTTEHHIERQAMNDITLPATYKGETGWLKLRIVNGTYRYAVTMDEAQATKFRPGSRSLARHTQRAVLAGLTITKGNA
jgi:hypothetical protein